MAKNDKCREMAIRTSGCKNAAFFLQNYAPRFGKWRNSRQCIALIANRKKDKPVTLNLEVISPLRQFVELGFALQADGPIEVGALQSQWVLTEGTRSVPNASIKVRAGTAAHLGLATPEIVHG